MTTESLRAEESVLGKGEGALLTNPALSLPRGCNGISRWVLQGIGEVFGDVLGDGSWRIGLGGLVYCKME